MNERRLVDTNLIIRYLVQDHESHARTATKLFEACDRGELILLVLPAVLAECVFVLESFYGHPRGDIARVLGDLISSPGVEMSDPAIHQRALDHYGKTKLHFVDCVIAAHATAKDTAGATFDADFRKLPDVRVEID